MSKAKQLLEAIYKVYNPQEEIEEYGQEKPEFRRNFDSEDLRKQFIGTILTSGTDNNPMKLLKDCIEKMSDDWVAEFLKVINGDVVEQVNESVNEEKTEFQVGDFVYDGTSAFDKGFGLIEEINGDTAQVRIYRTKHGALSGAVQSTELKNLKDGNIVIDQEIQSLERKIQTQKNIRDQIMAIAKGEV